MLTEQNQYGSIHGAKAEHFQCRGWVAGPARVRHGRVEDEPRQIMDNDRTGFWYYGAPLHYVNALSPRPRRLQEPKTSTIGGKLRREKSQWLVNEVKEGSKGQRFFPVDDRATFRERDVIGYEAKLPGLQPVQGE